MPSSPDATAVGREHPRGAAPHSGGGVGGRGGDSPPPVSRCTEPTSPGRCVLGVGGGVSPTRRVSHPRDPTSPPPASSGVHTSPRGGGGSPTCPVTPNTPQTPHSHVSPGDPMGVLGSGPGGSIPPPSPPGSGSFSRCREGWGGWGNPPPRRPLCHQMSPTDSARAAVALFHFRALCKHWPIN